MMRAGGYLSGFNFDYVPIAWATTTTMTTKKTMKMAMSLSLSLSRQSAEIELPSLRLYRSDYQECAAPDFALAR